MCNKLKVLFVFVLGINIFLTSCRIEKKLYSNGYYININKGKQHAQKIAPKDESTSSSSKELKSNNNAIKETENVNEDEPILASESNQIYINQNNNVQNDNQNQKKENYITFNAYKKELNKGVKKIKEHQKLNGSSMNGLALAGFICSIVGLVLFGFILGAVAVVLSAIGLHKIKQDPINWDGKGLAIAGIIIGFLDIIGWLIFILLFF